LLFFDCKTYFFPGLLIYFQQLFDCLEYDPEKEVGIDLKEYAEKYTIIFNR